jgi:hypothetical protein
LVPSHLYIDYVIPYLQSNQLLSNPSAWFGDFSLDNALDFC